MKGTYILLMELKKADTITVGKLGTQHFPQGYYAYVGSALNNLEARIQRHHRPPEEKKEHWHIDYLLQHANILETLYIESSDREECNTARKLAEKHTPITHFGSTDCKCQTHLYYSKAYQQLKEDCMKALGVGSKTYKVLE